MWIDVEGEYENVLDEKVKVAEETYTIHI